MNAIFLKYAGFRITDLAIANPVRNDDFRGLSTPLKVEIRVINMNYH
jgi:hypothetical protein